MESTNKKIVKDSTYVGSALILTVVLTSLLAIIGVLFVMSSRVDKMATSAISDTKELGLAVDTVVAKISRLLVQDVPGIGPNEEYYDYPDVNNLWLASLEPSDAGGGNVFWLQISDVYGVLVPAAREWQQITPAQIIPEYQDAAIFAAGLEADADGDGVFDSRWVILPGISSSKGRPIFAAIRIIDHGGMLNVNTGYRLGLQYDLFDPNLPSFTIDGSSQMQINLMALSWRPNYTAYAPGSDMDLLWARSNYGLGIDPCDLAAYEQNVIWRYDQPKMPYMPYTPFDISDELELRYRFLLNHTDIDTRLETLGSGAIGRAWEFRRGAFQTPALPGKLGEWFISAYDIGVLDPNYAYRHITTTYNMDRVIRPDGNKMINVNTTSNISTLYNALLAGIDPNYHYGDVNDRIDLAAQLAVNIWDYRDGDVDISTFMVGRNKMYYGFEPQPFISEIAFKIGAASPDTPANNHYAVELYNPFDVDISLGNFTLEFRSKGGGTVSPPVTMRGRDTIRANSRFVITNSAAASNTFGVSGLISMGDGKESSSLVPAKYTLISGSDPPDYSVESYDIYLLRNTGIYLDKQQTVDSWFDWDVVKDQVQAYNRPDDNWNVVYQNVVGPNTIDTLGRANGGGTKVNYNLSADNSNFVTVGDIARVLTVGPSTDPNDMIGMRLAAEPPEEQVRLDLRNSDFRNIFRHLTVIDPRNHSLPANETRVKGRININTAPWFVLAQLPWMSPGLSPHIAQAVVAYRDKTIAPGGSDYRIRFGEPGFESIGELMQVGEMGFYAYDPCDLTGYPDLTANDGAGNDFEELNVIFSRISNLVTVRSDVFTAYILVRIGVNGPQKRVIAIFDRSESPNGRVKIIALHSVGDPR